MKNKLSKIFATEEIAKEIIGLGFDEFCLAKHAGFKLFGESPDKLQHKFVHNTDKDGPWTDLQQKYDMPFFAICPAPVWQQVTDWFRDVHDIDIDITKIRHDAEFNFLFSVLVAGKLMDSGRTVTHTEALEKSILSAIELKK